MASSTVIPNFLFFLGTHLDLLAFLVQCLVWCEQGYQGIPILLHRGDT